MARKQAKRRKQKKSTSWSMPSIRVSLIVGPVMAIGVVVATFHLSSSMLDRKIRSIEVSGPFQRVTALQIEEAISDELEDGFVSADLASIQQRIVDMPWIDSATVARRWPSRLRINVTEQVPAAIWGESGLLNVRGELFVDSVRHIPAELPRLSGPEGRSGEVARRYLAVRDRLIPVGLDLRRVHLDPRGAWEMTLHNGVEVRLGRRETEDRTELFLDIVADIITSRAAEIEYVDMRYSNGFTIGWNNGSNTPVTDPVQDAENMMALRGRL
jgi:cell division protein FtsQ